VTVTLWLALLLQFVSVALLRLFLGKTWLRRPGTLLVIASVVYDGVSQVLLSFPSVAAWDAYRNGVQQGFAGEADLVMSAGMLAFTIAYLLAGPGRHDVPLRDGDAAAAARALDWRLLALACAPLAVLTYEGRGYNGVTRVGPTGALAAGFTPSAGEVAATAFFTLLVVLTACGFLLRHGGRWFVPVLLAQSALLAAAGERTPVVTDAVTLIVLLARAGMRPRGRDVLAAGALTAVAVLAVTGVRAGQGRGLFTSDTGLAARVSALGDGVAGSRTADGPGLAAQTAARLDGTAFAGAVLQAEHLGQPRLSAAWVPESLLITVPSALWPSKLAHGQGLDPYDAEIDDFGLQQVNFLPGATGLYAGFLPPAWLIAFLAALGLAAGRGEAWLLRRLSPARLVLLAGGVLAALLYPAGLPGMLSAFRGAVVLAAAVWVAAKLRLVQRRENVVVIRRE
jgi:hypothetical protein